MSFITQLSTEKRIQVHNNMDEHPHSTCLYGDRLTLRAVAHEVGGNNVKFVVGAALQAVEDTEQVHGVAAVNDAVAVRGHCDVEQRTAVHGPAYPDGVVTTCLGN